jgi:hypothetical protein
MLPGSEVALSLDTCSIAAFLSSMTTARDWSTLARFHFAPWSTYLSVKLEEAFPRSLVGVERPNRQKLDSERLPLLNGDGQLLPNSRLRQEVSSRYNPTSR